MYNYLLLIHNLFRWIILIMVVFTLYNNYRGWRKKKTFTRRDKALNSAFVGTLDIQFVIGLVLYFFFSSYTKEAFQNMAEAMKHKDLRYWAVEHITMMVAGLVIAHIGSVVSRKSKTDEERFRKAFYYFLVALIIILAGMPWFHVDGSTLNPFNRV
jgi:uncharacterized membrane protein YfcA